ncbi:MAG: hypothetical protein RL376_51, partial [Verrucomicrobiota bacterium]
DPHGAKAGLMFRESTAANARYAYVAITPSGELKFEYRTTTGAAAVSGGLLTGFSTPVYLRLIRTTRTIRALYSTNGTTWTQLGSTLTITLPSTARAGLAVTSGQSGILTTATFDQVTIP